MTSRDKTDIPRFRTFGIRVCDRFIEHLRSTLHPELDFPSSTYDVKEDFPHGTTNTPHHLVEVEARCCYGSSVELKVDAIPRGKTITASFQAEVFIHGARERWRGEVRENARGVIEFEWVNQIQSAATA